MKGHIFGGREDTLVFFHTFVLVVFLDILSLYVSSLSVSTGLLMKAVLISHIRSSRIYIHLWPEPVSCVEIVA